MLELGTSASSWGEPDLGWAGFGNQPSATLCSAVGPPVPLSSSRQGTPYRRSMWKSSHSSPLGVWQRQGSSLAGLLLAGASPIRVGGQTLIESMRQSTPAGDQCGELSHSDPHTGRRSCGESSIWTRLEDCSASGRLAGLLPVGASPVWIGMQTTFGARGRRMVVAYGRRDRSGGPQPECKQYWVPDCSLQVAAFARTRA